MDWYITPPDQNPTQVLSLDEVKAVLRIEDSAQDDKIQSQINSCVSMFEQATNYLIRSGVLSLNFGSRNLYNRRRNKNFLANYTAGTPFFTSLVTNDSVILQYSLPLAGKIPAQRPLSFSFNNSKMEAINLTQDEIQNLPENFFFPLSSKPLLFSLKSDELESKFLDDNAENISMEININSGRDFSKTGDDIKECIMRMVSRLFEFPDFDINNSNDSFIIQTITHYNYKLKL